MRAARASPSPASVSTCRTSATPRATDWWDKDPVVEVGLYDDTHFPFSTATRRQVQQAAAEHPAPWTGHRLEGHQSVMSVRGLRALNGVLLRNEAGRPWDFGPEGRSYDDDMSVLLGGWWLVLRFHQAVSRDWPEVGPVLGVPLVVGQHGTGPWQVSAFTPGDDGAGHLVRRGRVRPAGDSARPDR